MKALVQIWGSACKARARQLSFENSNLLKVCCEDTSRRGTAEDMWLLCICRALTESVSTHVSGILKSPYNYFCLSFVFANCNGVTATLTYFCMCCVFESLSVCVECAGLWRALLWLEMEQLFSPHPKVWKIPFKPQIRDKYCYFVVEVQKGSKDRLRVMVPELFLSSVVPDLTRSIVLEGV